jgi:predicted ATPase/DNA-binding CsgD family transcriptional regulator
VALARERLLGGAGRLLTLTGPPGVGKTRLALEVAASLRRRFPDGVAFVDLAPVADPARVVPAVADALGLRVPADRELLAGLVGALRRRRALLVLDNFEHLLPAAPAVAALLAGCPGLAVLATSRAALRLRGERELPVAPLPVPDDGGRPAAAVAASPAVALFTERAQDVRPDFSLTESVAGAVAEICRRLDGLPLALELAAAWLRLLPPDALLARLDRRLPLLAGGPRNLPERQRTLRDAITWSHDLLEPEQRALFRRLAMFPGGWTTEGAEAVCAAQGAAGAALDDLAALVDWGLVRPLAGATGDARFGMLQTIREYALERLEASGEAEAVRGRWAAYFLRLAEAAEPALRGGRDQVRWLGRLDEEHDNLRAVLAWATAGAAGTHGADAGAEEAAETGRAVLGLRLATALARFWVARGHLREGQQWTAAARRRCPQAPPALRAKALWAEAFPVWSAGDFAAARPVLEESLALYRAVGDPLGAGLALRNLAQIATEVGDVDAARHGLEESVVLSRAAGDTWNLAWSLASLGRAAREAGDPAAAARWYAEALPMFEALGDPRGTGWVLLYLGTARRLQGELDAAQACYERGLPVLGELGELRGAVGTLSGLALVAAGRGRWARSLILGGAASALAEAAGYALPPRAMARARQELEPSRVGLGAAAPTAWERGRTLSLAEAIAYALAPEGPEPPTSAAAPRGGAPAVRQSGPTGATPSVPAGLTPREAQVLRLIAAGRSNRQIAADLVLSVRTVERHITNLYAKIGANGKADATAFAFRHGLHQ